MIVPRLLARPIRAALEDTPVVLITGARQTGKSTLASQLLPAEGTYRTLDDAATRAAALADPDGFVAGHDAMVIDEVQRAPELLLAIKAEVDRDRRPGRFVLTGSSDVMTLPAVADSLAGRVEIHRLRPFACAELAGEERSIIDVIASGDRPSASTFGLDRADLRHMLLRGGYPEAVRRAVPARRVAWLREYESAIIHREVEAVSAIQLAERLPRLMRTIAAAAPGTLNLSSIAAALAVPRTTVDRYVALLRQVFVLDLLPAWHANIGTRQVKSLRMLVPDSGLQAMLLGLDDAALERHSPEKLGALLETFVGHELAAQASWAETPATLAWWRTRTGAEVDFVIERAGGIVDGVEVKAATSITARDFRGLAALRDAMGDRFGHGIVLYTGSELLQFGDRLEAWPVDALWGGGAAD